MWRIPLALGVELLAAAPLQSQETPEQLARAAAESWLVLVDSGQYGQSWDAAAAAFQGAVTRDGWDSTLVRVRQPLGVARSRELLGAQHTRDLPGAPPGEYVMLQYRTAFANRPAAVETVVPMKGDDGTWRVSGYFIR